MKTTACVLILFLLAACATIDEFDTMKQDINDLKKGSLETRKDITFLKESLTEKTSGTVKEDSFAAVVESQAEINSRLSEISNNIQELRGRFEENKYNLEQELKNSAIEKDMLKVQITEMETQVKILREKNSTLEEMVKNTAAAQKRFEELKTGTEKPPLPAAAEPQEQTKPAPKNKDQIPEKRDSAVTKTQAYDAALQAFKDKKYKTAREKFEAFLKDYPQNDLTDNAQFWIGEAYYAEKAYEDAILAYETLLKQFPDSKKASGALLKQGIAFIEIGDLKTGKTILDKLVEKYPDSPEAVLARKKIAELNKKNGKKK